MSNDAINTIDIKSLSSEGETGYIFEVDLEYPPSLHDLHNDFPLAPEKITIKNENLSPYCEKMKEKLIGRQIFTIGRQIFVFDCYFLRS